MKRLNTLTGNPFQFKTHPDGELIIYTSDQGENVQNKSAIVVTPFTIDLVKKAIENAGEIKMGASRDNPPKNSLGDLIKQEKQSPQQLSYLIPILIDEGFCDVKKDGKAFIILNKKS